jgi:uncharacterized protein YprB with RNaseH-like and TPR domain
VWGLWNQNVSLSQIADVGTVLSFAAKWHGERAVEFRSVHHDGHGPMIARAHQLLDEADAVCGWNSKSFDVKHLHREFIVAGLGPPSGHVDIDLLTVARKRFKFASNKLDYVAGRLGVGSKVKHAGFELWLGCMAGDEAAWRKMRAYNIQDVRLTEKLYDRLLPWITTHPHRGLFGGPRAGCPRCESLDNQQRGYRVTATGRYIKYRCNGCKGYFTGTHRVEAVHHRAA